MDQPRIERILSLMKIMSGKDTFSIDELATKMDTSYRSIYRYIDTFRAAGFAVEKVKGNMYRIIKMPSSFKALDKLVYFSEEEACVVNGLIESLEETNSFKTELRKKLSAIYDMTDMSEIEAKSPAAMKILSLNEAIDKRRQVVLKDYQSGNSGTVRDRLVEPFEYTAGCIDIWAYDVENGDNRIFKVARIGKVKVLGDGWTHEENHRAGYVDVFRMAGHDRIHVKFTLSLRAKNLLLEEFPRSTTKICEDNGAWVFEDDVTSMAGVGRFVTGLAKEITIIDSPELKEYVTGYIRSALDDMAE